MKTVCCPDCRKIVHDKPFIGTLHVCLSPGEKAILDHGRWARYMQMRATEPGEQSFERALEDALKLVKRFERAS